jgi:hypothetical protein
MSSCADRQQQAVPVGLALLTSCCHTVGTSESDDAGTMPRCT